LISVPDLNGSTVRFGVDVLPVIKKGPDWNSVDELRNTPGMIVVVVSQQNILDTVYACELGGGENSVRIAALVAGPSGIDEKGVLVGSNKECGLTSFHVHEINLQIPLVC
jgi:hypothetical protein